MPLKPDNIQGLARLGRLYRHLGRAREVTAVLAKFGFDDLLVRVGLADLLDHVRTLVGLGQTRLETAGRPERVRLALEELGLVFIKWGQYLSTRDDLIPESYLREFARLQNAVQPLPLDEVERLTRGLLESGEVVKISPKPLAAASVGQVHEAVLADGRRVVIKVRRPGLKKQVTTDLEILRELAELVEKHLPVLAAFRPQSLVAEFSRILMAELDFSHEAANQERFGRFYAANAKVRVPRLHRALCGEDLLVMEKLEGLKFNDTESLKAAGYDLKTLALFGAEVVLEQIMIFGYFHGDPHPGNLLVQPGPKVALLDFGLVGRLNRNTREILLDLTLAVARRNARGAASAILKLAPVEAEAAPPDRERLEMELELFLEAHLGRNLKDLDTGRVLKDMLGIIVQHQLSPPPDLLLLIKALVQIEGLGVQLDPEFDILQAARPFLMEQYRRRVSPAYWARRLKNALADAADFLTLLPGDLKPFYQMLRGGRLKSDFTLEGLEELRQTLDRSSYRLSFAVVLASLVIASAVMVHAKAPPLWHGMPVLGILGFFGAAVVGFWLLYDFLKNNRF